MVSANVTRMLEQVKSLSLEEREQLRHLMDQQPAANGKLSKEEQLDQLLLERGIISQIPPQPTDSDVARFNEWKPIPVTGQPVSQTIVEDRR